MPKRRSAKAQDLSTGLPETSKPVSPLEDGYVVIGKFRRPHGVRGDMLFEVLTEFPERITNGKHIFVGEKFQEKIVTSARNHHIGLILHLEGYDNPEEVGVLRNMMVYAKIADLPELQNDELYQHELIGMEVVTVDGESLGRLSEFLETGANDVLIVIDDAGNELLLPDIPSVVLGIDPERHRIIVQPPEWL
jgi:16S rRNA processing protein RimM